MKSIFALLLQLVLANLLTAGTPPILTLYSLRNGQGSNVTLTRGSHYLGDFGDVADSMCGVGVWFLYEDPEYDRNSDFVADFAHGSYTCEDLDSSQTNKVSSARHAGTGDIYEDSLTMYHHELQKGAEYLVVRDVDFLRETFEDVATSFVITGSSPWTVHEHPGMAGKSACMVPVQQGDWYYGIFAVEDLPDFNNDMVSSVSKGCNTETVIQYEPKPRNITEF